nr:XdhC/CoxI family protein [Pseudodesulfovibrio tunisiensis]
MKAFVRSFRELLDGGETLVLATVVDSSGSTPRSSGAKMAVRRGGSIIGTVGGGIMEAMACRDGAAMLDLPEGTVKLAKMELTQDLAANSDMICGGNLTIMLETVSPKGSGAERFREMDDLLRAGKSGMLLTTVRDDRAVEHVVFTEDSVMPAQCGEAWDVRMTRFLDDETGKLLAEPFVPPAPLYIFGAGHVSRSTARVAALAGFRVVVLDDREDFANAERFPEADEVRVLPSFRDAFGGLEVGDDAFLIIVTRGHVHDRDVLAQALATPARYVGMIGSKRKRDAIYDALRKNGTSDEAIARCHCPIGLKIGAQTPEEIAISIGAELVAARAGKLA